jgi:hypothetical protein
MGIHMVLDLFQRYLGLTPRFIKPEQLRLVPDSKSKSQFKLFCGIENHDCLSIPNEAKQEEVLEEIHQIGLELHQHELLDLEPEMLRQLNLCCFNDLCTVIFVHKEGILGIISSELKSLVAKGLLTPLQAATLEGSIAETFIPECPDLMHSCSDLVTLLFSKQTSSLSQFAVARGVESSLEMA